MTIAVNEFNAGRYSTRWTSVVAVPSSFAKYVDYDRRRIALTLLLIPTVGGGSIIVTVGNNGNGFSYGSREDDPGFVTQHTIKRTECGEIACGEVWALMTVASGVLTVIEYIDNGL